VREHRANTLMRGPPLALYRSSPCDSERPDVQCAWETDRYVREVPREAARHVPEALRETDGRVREAPRPTDEGHQAQHMPWNRVPSLSMAAKWGPNVLL
jgi:hypothetical protein